MYSHCSYNKTVEYVMICNDILVVLVNSHDDAFTSMDQTMMIKYTTTLNKINK